MPKLYILGLGESIQYFPKNMEVDTLGVNDVYRYVQTDRLVCIDPQKRFTPERLEVIKKSTPRIFYSHLEEWSFMPGFQKIDLAPYAGILDSKIYHSNNSVFVGVSLGYQLGYTEMVLYGADFRDHKLVANQDNRKKIIDDFASLSLRLKERGVNVSVASSDSILQEVLPIYEEEWERS